MKALFIGGTGNISAAVSRRAIEKGIDLHLLTRGKRKVDIPGAKTITADIRDVKAASKALEGRRWDCVVNWIGYTPDEVERDIELFRGKTKQYIYISSASAYQKPVTHPVITEATPLANPYWEYSRNKIACEERLMKALREEGFPMTIVRPSLTYDTVIPVAIGGWNDYTVIDRIKKGKPMVVHGDGTSLWTITHSEDFAKGFVGLIGHQQAIGHAFHITSDEVLTWNQIMEAVYAAAGAEPNYIHMTSDFIIAVCKKMGQGWMEGGLLGDKAVSAVFDNTKIKTFVPEFKATIPFKQGIQQTVEWFEADPARMTIVDGNNELLDALVAAHERAMQTLGD